MAGQTHSRKSVGENREASQLEASPEEEFVELDPVTPGEILEEEFLKPMGITKYRLAKEIHVPATRIGEIVAGTRRITADTDLRLCRFFGLSDGFWLRLQVSCDEEIARHSMGDELDEIRPLQSPKDDFNSIGSLTDTLEGEPDAMALRLIFRESDDTITYWMDRDTKVAMRITGENRGAHFDSSVIEEVEAWAISSHS